MKLSIVAEFLPQRNCFMGCQSGNKSVSIICVFCLSPMCVVLRKDKDKALSGRERERREDTKDNCRG